MAPEGRQSSDLNPIDNLGRVLKMHVQTIHDGSERFEGDLLGKIYAAYRDRGASSLLPVSS